jgi:CxxC motif-containing protein (DUF1111 family)
MNDLLTNMANHSARVNRLSQRLRIWVVAMIGTLVVITACNKLIPPPPPNDQLLDGPVSGLSEAEHRQFLAGDVAFNDRVFTASNGLGPIFVATSCGSCHPGDGKGHPFTTLTRYGQSDSTGNHWLDQGGPQLQNRALPGFEPEAMPNGAPFSSFTPPAVTGLGFLAALTDQQILSHADPADADGDGISGVANYIAPRPYFEPKWFHQPAGGRYIGRFGKKAGAIDLLMQTVNAYNQDIGITSTFEPVDPYSHHAGDPEVSTQTVRDVVFYLNTLRAPVPRDEADPQVQSGEQLFMQIGCAGCHVPEWTTPESEITALSHKTIHPYTDLLLHDMGPGLDDGYTEGAAITSEWRTPALWGLGLSKQSQGGTYFLLHDGRAHSIEEAILLHGGEGSQSRDKFQHQLSDSEREALIKFLESL